MKTTTLPLKHSTNRRAYQPALLLIPIALACFASLPRAQGQLSPPPDGCYTNFTTAEGCAALVSLTTGVGNTGLGWRSLVFNSAGSFNTGVGAGALALNDEESNTAVGAAALLLNISGFDNTAVGTDALVHNDGTAFDNAGSFNAAFGSFALSTSLQGVGNVAIGHSALSNSDSNYNTAVGLDAGENLTAAGSDENIYIGDTAGTLDFLGNPAGDEAGVIRIGSFFSGTAACFINGIANNGPFADAVRIDPATGQLGGLPSSARFKKDIEPMDKTSEAIYSLKPVTFHYKKDKTNTPWFGLIAEDVAKVNPALIGVDKEGKPYCVAYDKVNAMLLNEFLKEHLKVEQLEKQVEALTAGLQKVSAQLELTKAAPQTVLNNH